MHMRLLKRSPERVLDEHLTYFTVSEANDFRRLVERSFAVVGRDVSVHPDHVEDRDGTTLGLWNIGMLCAHAEPIDWPDLIDEHVRLVTPPPRSLADLSHEQVESGLYLRLVETASVPDPDALGYARVVAPGLLEVLSVDMPDAVAMPSRDELTAHGTLGDLLGRGRANLRALLAGDRLQVDTLGEETRSRFTVVKGDSFFTASLALVLPEAMLRFTGESHGGRGTLVAVPNRHQLLYRAVDAPDAGVALRTMFEVALRDFRSEPGPLSPNVFWVRNGRWVPVTSCEAGKTRVVLGELRGELKTF
jgi:hypothetical protein